MKRTLLLMTAAIAAGACGGDDGSAFEAIYEVDTWTENDTSCDSEGADVIGNQFSTTFYIKKENFLGVKFLNLNFCDDVADCEQLAGEADTINLGLYGFDQGNDSDGWHSEFFAGFPNADGVCEGDYRVMTLTSPSDGVARVEIRDTAVSGFAPDADDFCEDEPGRAAAEGEPCTGLEAFSATVVAELP